MIVHIFNKNQEKSSLVQEIIEIVLSRASYNIDKGARMALRVIPKAASPTACPEDKMHIIKTELQVSES